MSHAPHLRRGRVAVAALLVALGVARLGPRTEAAGAAVGHVMGYAASVDGFRSWYGSYDLGAIGTAWCIDHGSRAPDPALGYVPTPVADQPADLLHALAWALGRHGRSPDRPTAAALMLVAHDLLGARYPSGDLDVDRLTPADLVGFGADAEAVLAAARAAKADGLAHAHLRPPYALVLDPIDVHPGREGVLVAHLVDRAGAPVAGVALSASATGAAIVGPAAATTGPDGVARFGFRAVEGPYRLSVAGTAPDLALQAFAPTAAAAQRVARPASVELAATIDLVGTAPRPPGHLVVVKAGDAEPFLPVTGARFEVWREIRDRFHPVLVGDAALVVGPDGRAGPVELAAGTYEVREVEPPPGYRAAPPAAVTVPPGGTVEVHVEDVAVRGALSLRKVDADTGLAVAGARLEVRRDGDGDGEPETVVAVVDSGVEPVAVADLLPGPHRVTELAAPEGYDLDATPVDVVVRGGEVLDVVLADRRTPPPSTTTTTMPPSTTTTTTTTVRVPRAAPTLPRTGGDDPVGLGATGTGLVLLGTACVRGGGRPRRDGDVPRGRCPS